MGAISVPLAPEDRERLRSAWRRLQELPPEEREQLLNRLLEE